MSRRQPGRTQAAIWLALLAVGPTASAQDGEPPDSERYVLRAELGAEYDSNAHRTELVAGAINPPVVASPVERLVISGALSDLIANGQAIALSATAAAKLFDAAAARDENVAIAQSSAGWRAALGPRTTLTVAGAYYEAFQHAAATADDQSERRDFQSTGPTVQLGVLASEHLDVTAGAGYRWFVFKSDRDEDFHAPSASLDARWTREIGSGAEWEASAGAGYEHRRFGGPALVGTCPAPAPNGFACSGPDTRADEFWIGHLDATRVGRILLGAGYGMEVNRSNSYGQTVVREMVSARFATALPAGLTLAARGELLFAQYADRVVIGQLSAGSTFVSIEDENRSNVRIDLSRQIGSRARGALRYTFYANELGSGAPVSYRRQTLLVNLAFSAEK
jgi:hypothetical protein